MYCDTDLAPWPGRDSAYSLNCLRLATDAVVRLKEPFAKKYRKRSAGLLWFGELSAAGAAEFGAGGAEGLFGLSVGADGFRVRETPLIRK